MRRIFTILLLLSFVLFSQNAMAALKSNKEARAEREANPAAAYNPKPAVGDVSLPMPGNLQLVLRPVLVNVDKVLADKQIRLGNDNVSDDRRAIESSLLSHVSAPFLFNNLTKEWQGSLKNWEESIKKENKDASFTVGTSDKDNKGPFFYFIGKYELSNGQWDAVMGEESGLPPDEPKTNISWYDLQDFLHKYNEWLLHNHPDKLSMIGGMPGFLRLPTEAEWVYAAMGANRDQAQINEYGLKEGENIADYAIFNDKPLQRIGSKKGNEDQIYDMNGNVEELVQNGFHFIVTEMNEAGQRESRFHGSEGGLIKKGGKRISGTEQIKPGYREEAPLVTRLPSGKYEFARDPLLGARLVFSAYNMQSGERTKKINQELKDSSQTSLQRDSSASKTESAPEEVDIIAINIHGDPLVELEKLYKIAPSDSMKESLDQYKQLIEDFNQGYAREHDANLLNNIRSTVFLGDAINNIAFRCFEQENRAKIAETLKNITKDEVRQMRDKVHEQFANLVISTNQYKNNVRALARVPAKELQQKTAQLKMEYTGSDRFNNNFRKMIDNFSKHADLARKQGNRTLDNNALWKDIIIGNKTQQFISSLDKAAKGQ